MNRFNILILSVFIFISCQSDREEKNYYENGQVKILKYYPDKRDTSNYYVTYYHYNGLRNCEGRKSDAKKIGKWIYYFENDSIDVIENYCNGLLSDTQTYFFQNGKIRLLKILDQPIPCFCDSIVNQSFTQLAYWANGNIREISHIKDCEFDGMTQLFDSATGLKYEEYFEEMGVKNGIYKMYYMDGSVMTGQYHKDNPIGHWKIIRNDSIISEMNYE